MSQQALSTADDLEADTLVSRRSPVGGVVQHPGHTPGALLAHVRANPQLLSASTREDFQCEVIDKAERQPDGAFVVSAAVMAEWTTRHPAHVVPPAQLMEWWKGGRRVVAPRQAPRGRSSRTRRVRHVGVSGGRGRTVDRQDDPSEPSAAVAFCAGCGEAFRPSSRQLGRIAEGAAVYCRDACSNRARQRKHYRKEHPERKRPAVPREDETLVSVDEAREHVHALAARRHRIWCALLSANGSGPALRVELGTLNRQLEHAWAEVRRSRAGVKAAT